MVAHWWIVGGYVVAHFWIVVAYLGRFCGSFG